MALDFLTNPGFWGGPLGGAVTSFGFPLLARLMGSGRAEEDLYKQQQQQLAMMRQLMSPQHLDELYAQNYGRLDRMGGADRTSALVDSMALGNQLQSAYARAGDSGLGATAGTVASSGAGRELRRLEAFNRGNALSMAGNQQQQQFNAAGQMFSLMGARPTPGLDALAQGINNYGGALNDYFKKREGVAGQRAGAGQGGVPPFNGPMRPFTPTPMLTAINPFQQLGRQRFSGRYPG